MRLGPWAPRGTGRAPSPRQRWQPRSSAAHDCRAGVVAVSVPQTWPSLSRADGPSMLNGPRISRRDHAYKHLLCELILCELFQWHRPRVQTLSGTNHATNTERQRSRAYALSGADRAYKRLACRAVRRINTQYVISMSVEPTSSDTESRKRDRVANESRPFAASA